MLKAGNLRNRITIQRRGDASGRLGNPKAGDWVDLVAVWADIRQPTGLGTIRADAQTSVVRVSIRIRFRTDVEAGMRVLHGVGGAPITDISRAEEAVVTAPGHGLSSGHIVRLVAIEEGMVEASGLFSKVSVIDASRFVMVEVNSTAFSAYIRGGKAAPQTVYSVKVPLPDNVRREYVDLVCEVA